MTSLRRFCEMLYLRRSRQDADAEHCEQLQPQDDFPCFLLFTRLATAAAITAASTSAKIIVPRLFKSQDIGFHDSFFSVCLIPAYDA